MAYIGKEPIVGNFQKCDALTASATADYTLQVGSSNVSPESVNHMIVSLNGVIQEPGATGGFTVSGSTLSFTSALTSNDTIDFVILLGNVLDIGTPSDGTVTNAKLAQDIISGETALTSEPASTDEILLSDAGTLKRIDYSLITNTPAFEATLSSGDVSISDDTATKLNINDEIYDSDSCYDNSSNYRFTPDVAGKYYVYGSIYYQGSANDNVENFQTMLYKNGSPIKVSYLGNPEEAMQSGCIMSACVTDMNGSSDYLELFGFTEFSTGTVSAKSRVDTYFGAYRITGA